MSKLTADEKQFIWKAIQINPLPLLVIGALGFVRAFLWGLISRRKEV